MKKIKLDLGKRSYDIMIGKDALCRLPEYLNRLRVPRDIFVITNSCVYSRYGAMLKRELGKDFTLKFYTTIDSEKAKSIASAVRIIEFLAGYAGHKKIAVCAFGGGVIGDLAGFIASIYKRGVPLVEIPTTLLAQIDSGIGGKTAIDLFQAKNLVGTFYQPKAVLCDLNFLLGLDKKQLRSGLAEAVKYAVIRDKGLFEFLEDNYQAVFSKDISALNYLVYTCANIKAKIVQADEREEKGIRTILNFGHTIGHAIEAAGSYTRYGHGEAIALGMLSAARISEHLGLLDSQACLRVSHLLAKIGLPQEVAGIKEIGVLRAYKLDKKFSGKRNRFVLLKGIGSSVVYENVPEGIIRKSVSELFIN